MMSDGEGSLDMSIVDTPGPAGTGTTLRRRSCIALLVVAALVAPMSIDPGVARAGEVFDTPDLPGAPRVDQARDVTSVPPARVVDTRNAPGAVTVDGLHQGGGPTAPRGVLEVKILGRGGVPPTGATAAMLNVTVVRPDRQGWVTVFPCGATQPNASTVNFVAGENRPNAVLAKIGSGGRVCFYTSSPTHLVVDVNGYVSNGSTMRPLTPARLLETRDGQPTVDGEDRGGGPVGAGSIRALSVLGRGGVPPSGVGSVIVNVTAVQPRGGGWVTVFPCGATQPNASSLNYVRDRNVANQVLAKLGDDGTICLYSTASTDLIVDVTGWVAGSSGTTSVEPARLLETRSGETFSTVDTGYQGIGRLRAGTPLELQVSGRAEVPKTGVGAAVLNVTATRAIAPGFITVYPCGSPRPNASNVNYVAGQNTANSVLARLGEGGRVCIVTSTDTDVVVDVTGYTALAPNQPDNNVDLLTPAEVAAVSFAPTPLVQDVEGVLGGSTERAFIETVTPPDVAPGDYVVMEKPNGDPYYGRVTKATAAGVETEPAALADVVPTMDLSLETDTATGATTAKDGGEAVRDVQVGGDAPAAGEQQKQPAQVDCSTSRTLSVDVTADADPGRFVFDVSYDLFAGLQSARVGYNPVVTARTTVTAAGAASCTVSKALFTKQLPTIRFSIGIVPVVITHEMSLGVTGEVSAAASVSRTFDTTANAWVGITYRNGQWDREARIDLSVDQSSTADIEVSLSLSFPTVTYTAKAYGIVGFSATVAPTVTLSWFPLRKKYLTLTAQVDVSVSLVVSLKELKIEHEHEFLRLTLWGPKELWSLKRPVTNCNDPLTGSKTITASQCSALMHVYEAANGAAWTVPGPSTADLPGWGEASDPCTWYGVTCDVSSRNVTALRLTDVDEIQGQLPAELGDLRGLRILHLTRAPGSDRKSLVLPDELGELTNLRELWLTTLGVPALPSSIGNLTKLEELSIGGNRFTSLPESIGLLTNLRELDLNNAFYAQFDDPPLLQQIPWQIGDLTNLERLWIEGHPGVPGIPESISRLLKLQRLFLSGMGLTSLPKGFGRFPQLQQLWVNSNELTAFPYLPAVPKLTDLNTNGNSITGDITRAVRTLRDTAPDSISIVLGPDPSSCPSILDPEVLTWYLGHGSDIYGCL